MGKEKYGNSRIEPITGEAGNLGGIIVKGKKPKYNYLRTHTVHTHPLTFSDALKGIDTVTGPLLHFMQPTQYVGAVRDAIEGKNPFISIIKGNSGFFDEQYAKEHPWISTFGNLIGDVGILTAPKTLSTIKAINDTQIARSNALSAEALRAASNPSSSHIIGETVRTNVLGEPIVNEAVAWQNGQRAVLLMLYPKGLISNEPLIARGSRPYTSPQSSRWRLLLLSEPIMDESIRPTLTKKQFEYSFNQGRYKSFEDLLKYNISKENAQKLFDIANSMKKKIGKFSSENLKGKKDRALYDAILNNAENNMFRKKGANVEIKRASLSPEEEKLLTILEEYNPILEGAFNRVKKKYGLGIDWNWENSYFTGMPLEFKIKPLYDPNVNGISDTRPFIQRFYENVSKITKEDGLMDNILLSGELRPKGNRWEGLNELTGKYEEVDPTLYIVSKLKNYKESGNRLTTAAEKIPYHGTMGTSSGQSNWSELSKKYANGAMTDDDNAIFTVIKDDMSGVGSMMGKYKLGKRGEEGVSIPFFRKSSEFEHHTYPIMDASDPEIIKRVGSRHMSNDYGIWGELRSYFRGHNGGYALEVKAVTDPQSSGLIVNEYNFGSGTPNVKSIWNTLDFEPMKIIRDENGKIINIIKTSPFAYNKSTNTNNNYLA